MLRLSVCLAVLLSCVSAWAQAPSPQQPVAAPAKAPPQAIPPAQQYPGAQPGYYLVPAPQWYSTPAIPWTPQALMGVQAYAAPAANPCSIVLGPSLVGQGLAAVGRRMATLGQKQWVIQRVATAPVQPVVVTPVVAQPAIQPPPQPGFVPSPPVFFSGANPSREAAPPPPVAPSPQKQAAVWPPSNVSF
jgi:hypothetical protein